MLEELAALHPVPAKIVEYRALTKLKGTYVDALPALVNPRTGRLHTTFNQAVAATGRLSSSDPNLQNIPIRTEVGRRIREAFVAEPGLPARLRRLLADRAAHPGALFARTPRSSTPSARARTSTSARRPRSSACRPTSSPSEHRRIAKAINFGLVFGQSDFGLAQALGIPRAQARSYIDSYFARYAGVRAYMERAIAERAPTGEVTTLLGRRRPLPEIRATRGRTATTPSGSPATAPSRARPPTS